MDDPWVGRGDGDAERRQVQKSTDGVCSPAREAVANRPDTLPFVEPDLAAVHDGLGQTAVASVLTVETVEVIAHLPVVEGEARALVALDREEVGIVEEP